LQHGSKDLRALADAFGKLPNLQDGSLRSPDAKLALKTVQRDVGRS
jgi:hypothetical protein